MKQTYLLMVYFNYPNRMDTYCFEASGWSWEEMNNKINNFISKQCSLYDSDSYKIVGLIKQ